MSKRSYKTGTKPRNRKIVNKKLQCAKCKEWFDVSNFYYCKKSPTGYQYECKQCLKNYKKQYINNKMPNYEEDDYKNIDIPKMKKCTKCGEILPITHFYKSTITKDGYYDKCYNCCNTRRRDRGYNLNDNDYLHYSKYFGGETI